MRIYTMLLLLLTAFAVSDATPKCDRSLITGITDDKAHFDNVTKRLTCHGEVSYGWIRVNNERYESITCDETNGWKAGGEKIADVSNVTCEEYCTSTGAIANFEKSSLNNDIIDIRCNDKFPGLYYNGTRVFHDSAICDRDGWAYYMGRIDKHRYEIDAVTPMEFECRKVCGIQGELPTNAHFDDIGEFGFTIKCNESDTIGEQFGIKLSGSSKHSSSVTCHTYLGWTLDRKNENYIADASASFSVECAKACSPSKLKDVYISTDESDGNPPVFKCNNTSANGVAYMLKLNGNFASPSIKCNLRNGYLDDNYKNLANELDNVDLECAPAPPCFVMKHEMVHFDNASQRFTCVGGANTIWAIGVDDEYFDFLMCDISDDEWKGYKLNANGDFSSTHVASSLLPLTVYCLRTGTKPLTTTTQSEKTSTHKTPLAPTAKPPVNNDDNEKDEENDHKPEQPKEEASSAQSSLIIAGASIGAIIIITIIAVIIFKVVSARKRRPAEKKSNMSGKTKSMKTKTDMSGKTKSEMSKSEKSKSEKSKTEKTNKSEMSETKSEKTKSKMSGRMKKVKSGRKGEFSGADHNSSGL